MNGVYEKALKLIVEKAWNVMEYKMSTESSKSSFTSVELLTCLLSRCQCTDILLQSFFSLSVYSVPCEECAIFERLIAVFSASGGDQKPVVVTSSVFYSLLSFHVSICHRKEIRGRR